MVTTRNDEVETTLGADELRLIDLDYEEGDAIFVEAYEINPIGEEIFLTSNSATFSASEKAANAAQNFPGIRLCPKDQLIFENF